MPLEDLPEKERKCGNCAWGVILDEMDQEDKCYDCIRMCDLGHCDGCGSQASCEDRWEETRDSLRARADKRIAELEAEVTRLVALVGRLQADRAARLGSGSPAGTGNDAGLPAFLEEFNREYGDMLKRLAGLGGTA